MRKKLKAVKMVEKDGERYIYSNKMTLRKVSLRAFKIAYRVTSQLFEYDEC